jgi:hypothetical protein
MYIYVKCGETREMIKVCARNDHMNVRKIADLAALDPRSAYLPVSTDSTVVEERLKWLRFRVQTSTTCRVLIVVNHSNQPPSFNHHSTAAAKLTRDFRVGLQSWTN